MANNDKNFKKRPAKYQRYRNAGTRETNKLRRRLTIARHIERNRTRRSRTR